MHGYPNVQRCVHYVNLFLYHSLKLGQQTLGIEHIGSTAVPELQAKPVIDIMIGIKELQHSRQVIQDLSELNYEFLGEANVPGRLYFRKRGERAFNLAVCVS